MSSAAGFRPRVVLVWPGELPEPAMGLLSVGSELDRAGCQVAIIAPDQQERQDAQALSDLLRRHLTRDTLWVGLTVMTPMIPLALAISGLLRSSHPRVKIVWGGPHPTLYPQQTAAHPLVDLAVVGDGEATALELTDCLLRGGSLREVAGLAFKEGDKVVQTPRRPDTDLRQLGPPNYELFVGLDRYHARPTRKDLWLARLLPVYSASGCPFRCAFCINTVLKKPWRAKSARQLIDESESLVRAYGLEGVSFVDELFFASKRRVLEFIDMKRQRGMDFSWAASCSVHTLRAYSDQELAWCRENGWLSTGLGVESGSPAQLKRLNKRITPQQVLEAASRCERLGVSCSYSFLIGTPHETRSDMAATLRLMTEIKRRAPQLGVLYWAQVFRPYPGSQLYDQALALGFMPPADLEGWGEMAGDVHNGFTRPQDLPWLDQGDRDLINDLNMCVSVYLKRKEFVEPLPSHLADLEDLGQVPIGSIYQDITQETFLRYPPAPAPMPPQRAGLVRKLSNSLTAALEQYLNSQPEGCPPSVCGAGAGVAPAGREA